VDPRDHVVLGVGATARTGELVRDLGARRVLLVTHDDAAEHAAWVRGVLASSDVRVDTFTANRSAASVDEAIELVRWASGRGCEAVLGLGGDDVLALAQAGALLLAHGGRLEHYAGRDRVPGPLAPIVAIPTVATAIAHGCELASPEPLAIVDGHLRPTLTIVDPELHRSCPPELTRAYALAAMHRAQRSQLPYAERVVALIDDALPRALARPRDIRARCELALAALL
jgi:alcohol dehydrogenase